MGQSLFACHNHIVFSTKTRIPWLREMKIRQEMFSFLSGFCKELQCPALIVNGYEDHVHILVRMGKTITVPELIGRIKEGSSKWIRKKGSQFQDFYWQNGYGAFSVSATHLPALRKYIAMQNEHHQSIGFKTEYRRILNKNMVAYKEQYVWE